MDEVELPKGIYMDLGSSGSVAEEALWFLLDVGRKYGIDTSRLVPDSNWGPEAVAVTSALQRAWNIDDDGGFGVQTQQEAKEREGFDLFEAADQQPGVISTLIQPKGQPHSVLYYVPDLGTTPDSEEAINFARAIRAVR